MYTYTYFSIYLSYFKFLYGNMFVSSTCFDKKYFQVVTNKDAFGFLKVEQTENLSVQTWS